MGAVNYNVLPPTAIFLLTLLFNNYILPKYIVPPKEVHHVKPLKAMIWPMSILLMLQTHNSNTLPFLFNPFELKMYTWAVIYILKAIGLSLLETLVLFFIQNSKKLEFRDNNKKAKRLEKLQIIDYLFLFINSFVETIFVHHLSLFVLNDKYIIKAMDSITIINGCVSFYLLFLADDFFYAISHRIMHWGPLYPWIHKHHHRQPLPERGYLDAGNEHPLEQVIGLSCVFIAIRVISYITTIHVVSMFIYFNIYALLAILNHTRYDVKFYGFGFEYSVGAHEMHHRYPKSNYAQYFMYWDILMGTYKEYDDGVRFKTQKIEAIKVDKDETVAGEGKNEIISKKLWNTKTMSSSRRKKRLNSKIRMEKKKN